MLSLTEPTFRDIAALMQETCGLSFPQTKRPLVSSRLSMRIQKLGLDSFEDYLSLIRSADDGGEFQMAVNLLTTNETYFFREPDHFAILERELSNLDKRPLSVWSAACSFGDEVYSIAMSLADLQHDGRIGQNWSVLGTDISERVLQCASQGIYPAQRLQHVSPQRLKRYCLRGEAESDGLVQMQPQLLERARFGWLNLSQPFETLGPFDAVFLRNVLIYFDAPTKVRIVDRVLSQLRPNGLFFIGTAEGRASCQTQLRTLAPGVFQKIAD